VRVAIVGLGLLGASLAAALRQEQKKQNLELGQSEIELLVGVSSASTCEQALQEGLCDEVWTYGEIDAWKSRVDLIFLCTPIGHILSFMSELAASSAPFAPGAVLTDVGSTKAEICAAAQRLFSKKEVLFCGGHPMAGSEKSGLQARDPLLFESALWILCPVSQTSVDLSGIESLRRVLQITGARELILDPTQHDAYVGRVSHFPQLLSSALSRFAGQEQESLAVAGPGFRDLSRLALSNFDVWESIFRTNRSVMAQILVDWVDQMTELRDVFLEETLPVESLAKLFEEGRLARSHLHLPQGRFRAGLVYIMVQIADRPGMFDAVIRPLTDAGLDLRDIELMKIREGVDGTLRLAFRDPQSALEAQQLLAKQNVIAWLNP
jgi:prephenate dehydrogenase